MKKQTSHKAKRSLRHRRVRARVIGTASRPRLHVFKSNKHLYVSIVDDAKGTTIISASDAKGNTEGAKVDRARSIGEAVAKAAQEKGIKKVVFDRGGYRFHGRVKAVAEGARSAGLIF